LSAAVAALAGQVFQGHQRDPDGGEDGGDHDAPPPVRASCRLASKVTCQSSPVPNRWNCMPVTRPFSTTAPTQKTPSPEGPCRVSTARSLSRSARKVPTPTVSRPVYVGGGLDSHARTGNGRLAIASTSTEGWCHGARVLLAPRAPTFLPHHAASKYTLLDGCISSRVTYSCPTVCRGSRRQRAEKAERGQAKTQDGMGGGHGPEVQAPAREGRVV